jgi:hypothetical protein
MWCFSLPPSTISSISLLFVPQRVKYRGHGIGEIGDQPLEMGHILKVQVIGQLAVNCGLSRSFYQRLEEGYKVLVRFSCCAVCPSLPGEIEIDSLSFRVFHLRQRKISIHIWEISGPLPFSLHGVALKQRSYEYVHTEGPKKYIHTVPPPFSLTVLPFDKVAVAFMWLAPSVEGISHYIPNLHFS